MDSALKVIRHTQAITFLSQVKSGIKQGPNRRGMNGLSIL